MGVMKNCAFFHFLAFGDFVEGGAVGVLFGHFAVFSDIFAFAIFMMSVYPNLIERNKFMDETMSAVSEDYA